MRCSTARIGLRILLCSTRPTEPNLRPLWKTITVTGSGGCFKNRNDDRANDDGHANDTDDFATDDDGEEIANDDFVAMIAALDVSSA